MIDYKYNEDSALSEIKSYIDSTYAQHYSGKYQATDMIIDAGHGTGFCIGNIMKYAKRYGKKDGYNKKDLLKIIHYAIIQLHVHDQSENSKKYETIKLSPPSNSYFDVDYDNSIMNCYKRQELNEDDKCNVCDCWKSNRSVK